MLKSVRIIGASALFLLLGWTVPAGSEQDKQVHGGYYVFDPYYPGARFAISVVP